MNTIETGGPAFPVSTSNETDGHQDGPNTWQFPGMTLRDYFAAKAMPIAATFYDTSDEVCEEAASWCYKIADAMLAARKPNPNQ